MDLAVVDELEDFIRRGALWDDSELEKLVEGLDRRGAAGDAVAAQLARFLRSVLMRLRFSPVSARLRDDIEAIVYPRVWKLMEGVRDGVPEGELRTRLEVMNRRLARLFASE